MNDDSGGVSCMDDSAIMSVSNLASHATHRGQRLISESVESHNFLAVPDWSKVCFGGVKGQGLRGAAEFFRTAPALL